MTKVRITILPVTLYLDFEGADADNDEQAWIVTDDLTMYYGVGKTAVEAIENYFAINDTMQYVHVFLNAMRLNTIEAYKAIGYDGEEEYDDTD